MPMCSTQGEEIINGTMCSTQRERLEMGRCVVHSGRDYKWVDVYYIGGEITYVPMCST